jgi:co-chaperonin GroES (HSP10)
MKIEPYHNKIIFLPDYGSEDFTVGDMKIQADASYDPGRHQPITGTIVAVPDKLIYGKDDSQEWDVPMEASIGDKAIVDFFLLFNAIEEQHTMEILGKRCVFLPYGAIICLKRVDAIIPANGYVIGQAMTPQDITEYENLYKRKWQHDVRLTKVAHVGAMVNEYYYTKDKDTYDVQVGEVVVLDNFCDLRVENEGRETFFPSKMFYFHRKDVIGNL